MSLFDADGAIHVAEEYGKPERIKDVRKKNKRKQICLTCTKSKCNGNCKRFKEAELALNPNELHRNRKQKNREEISK